MIRPCFSCPLGAGTALARVLNGEVPRRFVYPDRDPASDFETEDLRDTDTDFRASDSSKK